MPAPNAISFEKLTRIIGTPRAPLLLDVRSEEDFAADPRLLPGATRIDDQTLADLAPQLGGQSSIAVCQAGHRRSQGTAAWLRAEGCSSEYLEGGFEAWRSAGLPLIDRAKLPARDAQGRTIWVTRSRPKIDRIACPWLIRRFLDPRAIILFVAPAEVEGVAERYNGSPFDIEGVFWSHRDDLCTFDVMLAEFGLTIPALDGSGQNMGVVVVVAARAKVSSLRVGLPWTYGLQSKRPSTTGRSALIGLTAFHDPIG